MKEKKPKIKPYYLLDTRVGEYVVRLKSAQCDSPLCGCPSDYEAQVVVSLVCAAQALVEVMSILREVVHGEDVDQAKVARIVNRIEGVSTAADNWLAGMVR